MLRAEITSDTLVEEIAESMSPESGRELSRTRARISRSDGGVTVSIEADDTSAMRAALNSYLECMMVVQNIGKITKVRQ